MLLNALQRISYDSNLSVVDWQWEKGVKYVIDQNTLYLFYKKKTNKQTYKRSENNLY